MASAAPRRSDPPRNDPRSRRRAPSTRIVAAALFLLPSVAAAEEDPPRPFIPAATLVWLAAQAIPSPELVVGDGGANGGLRWEVTPLLYSFGLSHPRRRFKVMRIEPPARLAGSVELVAAVEYLGPVAARSANWLARGGARAYLPLLSRGEALSFAIGGSVYDAGGRPGWSAEVGLFTLFGFTGLLATYSPGLEGGELVTTLCVRFF